MDFVHDHISRAKNISQRKKTQERSDKWPIQIQLLPP